MSPDNFMLVMLSLYLRSSLWRLSRHTKFSTVTTNSTVRNAASNAMPIRLVSGLFCRCLKYIFYHANVEVYSVKIALILELDCLELSNSSKQLLIGFCRKLKFRRHTKSYWPSIIFGEKPVDYISIKYRI